MHDRLIHDDLMLHPSKVFLGEIQDVARVKKVHPVCFLHEILQVAKVKRCPRIEQPCGNLISQQEKTQWMFGAWSANKYVFISFIAFHVEIPAWRNVSR